MKTRLYIISIGLLLTVLSCEQKSNRKSGTVEENRNTIPQSQNTNDNTLDYIIFGRYCEECGGECATMYKLTVSNDRLLSDHTDSYWEYRYGKPMKFATSIIDKTKISIAREVLDSIPNFLFTTTKPIQKFGCPDCTDGCGIYIETKKDTTLKKFLIDYQTEQLTGEIKPFAEYLKRIIEKLE